jgi:3-oxoacyl-[acyl-carrier protein] reductase
VEEIVSTLQGTGRLAGKTIIVTGAAHGIGRAYAERIANEGAYTVIIDLDGPALEGVMTGIRAAGGDGFCRAVDVRDFAALQQLAADAAAHNGRIDGCVNNAGMMAVIPMSRALFEDITEEEWDLMFNENIKSVWNCCRAWTPYMKDGKGGSIVNTSSGTVFKLVETRAHYVASKAAIVGLSRVLAKELGRHWIRVNTVAPGAVLSEEDPDDETIRNRERASPTRALQRIEYPEDVVGTVVFLLSDDSAFVTGQLIVVDGGNVAH